MAADISGPPLHINYTKRKDLFLFTFLSHQVSCSKSSHDGDATTDRNCTLVISHTVFRQEQRCVYLTSTFTRLRATLEHPALVVEMLGESAKTQAKDNCYC